MYLDKVLLEKDNNVFSMDEAEDICTQNEFKELNEARFHDKCVVIELNCVM